MRRLNRLARIMPALAGTAVLPAPAYSVGPGPELLPVSLTAPADGSAIRDDGGSSGVELAWSAPREPVPVRFFVEVVAIEPGGPREIFAGYVDRPPVDVALERGQAEYAWRVYTVGLHVAAYALSGWDRFSLQTTK
jgi:hypothetical protein